jgi:hypothetical protein
VSWGKGGLKRPSDAVVASAQPIKQTKKATFRLAVTMTTTGTAAGAYGSKVVVGMKKTTVPARKHRVPAIGIMVEASSVKSQESLPHG